MRLHLFLAKITAVLVLFAGGLYAGDSGFYLGGSYSYLFRGVDINAKGNDFIVNRESFLSVGLGGFVGYQYLKESDMYLANELGLESGLDINILEVLTASIYQSKVRLSDTLYLDQYVGKQFFSDALLLSGIVGLETTRYRFTAENIDKKKTGMGLRLGGAIGYDFFETVGIRLSVVQSWYKRVKFGTSKNYSLDPEWLEGKIALVWRI